MLAALLGLRTPRHGLHRTQRQNRIRPYDFNSVSECDASHEEDFDDPGASPIP